MIFRDYTLHGSGVGTRHTVDSRELVPRAVDIGRKILRRARTGAAEVGHGIPRMPAFSLRLGMPEPYQHTAGDCYNFTVGKPGQEPFQFNACIPADAPEEAAMYALLNVFGVSVAVFRMIDPLMELPSLDETVRALYEERPILVSTIFPAGVDPATDRDLIVIAADFSKCLAAAWFTEPTGD